MATVELEDYVTVTKAAGMLGCTGGRVRQLLSEDAFPGAVKVGQRAWLIPKKLVERRANVPQVRGRPNTRDARKKNR